MIRPATSSPNHQPLVAITTPLIPRLLFNTRCLWRPLCWQTQTQIEQTQTHICCGQSVSIYICLLNLIADVFKLSYAASLAASIYICCVAATCEHVSKMDTYYMHELAHCISICLSGEVPLLAIACEVEKENNMREV